MKNFVEVKPQELTMNPFTLIGKEWLLIAAQKEGRTNAMTASWGGLGVLWARNVAYIFVRDSRYTREFIDGAEQFALSVFDGTVYRGMLNYMGTVSGRDEDKIAKSGLTLRMEGEAPIFDEAKLVMVCKKLSCHALPEEGFLDPGVEKFYGDHDYHKMYVGEIVKILVEEDA